MRVKRVGAGDAAPEEQGPTVTLERKWFPWAWAEKEDPQGVVTTNTGRQVAPEHPGGSGSKDVRLSGRRSPTRKRRAAPLPLGRAGLEG